MLNRGIRLPFTLLGIPLILDWSFLIILPLLAWLIGSQVYVFADLMGIPQARELAAGWMPFLLGLIAALGLFASVVIHELGHAVTARAYGVPVRSITLWFLGGVARFEQMPRQRGAEAVVAIVGPIVSLALAGVCWLAFQAVSAGAFATRFVLAYLIYMNVVVAIFNMVPALPLDGGRVLRSLLAIKLPYLQATRIAAGTSRIFAILLGLLGLLGGNFFLLLIALFIFLAVSGETRSAQAEELLRGALARDLMNPDVRTVPPDIRVAELRERMMRDRHLRFPVVDPTGRVHGMVRAQDIEGRNPDDPVGQVMHRDVPTVRANTEAVEAYRQMTRDGFQPAIVTDEQGHIAGLISRSDLMRYMQLRSLSPDPAFIHESLTRRDTWRHPDAPPPPRQPDGTWRQPV